MSGLTPRLMTVITSQGNVQPNKKNHMVGQSKCAFGYVSIDPGPRPICDYLIDLSAELMGEEITPFADLAPITPTFGQRVEERAAATTCINTEIIRLDRPGRDNPRCQYTATMNVAVAISKHPTDKIGKASSLGVVDTAYSPLGPGDPSGDFFRCNVCRFPDVEKSRRGQKPGRFRHQQGGDRTGAGTSGETR
jgi:hypothetical protein